MIRLIKISSLESLFITCIILIGILFFTYNNIFNSGWLYYQFPKSWFDEPINHYSIIHFLEYGIFSFIKWVTLKSVLLISFLWEILELCIPYEWARESWANKVFDVIFNHLGFYGFRKIIKRRWVMGFVSKIKKIDKITSKYFVLFSIIVYTFLFGWHYSSGESIFSSIIQDVCVLFILVNQGVIISYLTWYKDWESLFLGYIKSI